jgi:hypothetical protein
VSEQIKGLSGELSTELSKEIGAQVLSRMHAQQGQRLADLALNMIDIIDSKFYERSGDVRWRPPTARRSGGVALKDGPSLGVLTIFFDWRTQARAVLDGVKFGDERRERARTLMLDSHLVRLQRPRFRACWKKLSR